MSEENTSPVKYLQVKGRVSGDYKFWGVGGEGRRKKKISLYNHCFTSECHHSLVPHLRPSGTMRVVQKVLEPAV